MAGRGSGSVGLRPQRPLHNRHIAIIVLLKQEVCGMDKERSGMRAISLKSLNIIMSVMAGAVALFMLYVAWFSFSNFTVMMESTQRHIASQRHAANLLAASDFLTEQVLSFALSGDKAYVDSYFSEVKGNQRRDNALKNLELYFSHSEAYRHLKKAMDRSNILMDRECRSMRLVIEALGQDVADYPDVLARHRLSNRDQMLSSTEKLALARSLLTDEEYGSLKGKIRADVMRSIDMLTAETQNRQEESTETLHKVMVLQFVLIGALLVLAFFFVAAASLLVVRPLRRSVDLMLGQRELPEDGAYELKYLARTYNRLFRQNKEHHRQLAYEAEHDPLTGLYNRTSFDRMREVHDKRSIALLLVDVDEFKSINDTYGHDIGDRILKKVAYKLLSIFREEDFVFRIGGDEFAVIMVYAKSELKQVVERKILECNRDLMAPEDGLPKVSLSVGVAFSDRKGGSDSIYKDADKALYAVKNRGRNGVAFFEGGQQEPQA